MFGMPKSSWLFIALTVVLCAGGGHSQVTSLSQLPGEKVDPGAALDRGLKISSLTVEGKPFHAVLEIGTAGNPYSGRVEVWWVDVAKYRESIESPGFNQTKIVNGDRVEEKDTGDYYPRWLENFELALMNPIPMLDNFHSVGGKVFLGANVTRSCIGRDDRPGGITDQMTWGQICFSGSEPHLLSVLTTTYGMTFSDWKGFVKKQIAHSYETDVLGFETVTGRLTKLEELKHPDETLFTVSEVTPVEQRISTVFVSTLKEESMVETVPKIEWPPVREGKTEGYSSPARWTGRWTGGSAPPRGGRLPDACRS
jgi:hypothetical protein